MSFARAVISIFLLSVLVGCSTSTPAPTLDTAAVFTQAYQTALAALPTNTPTPIPPTATNAPTIAPTATPQPLPTTVSQADAVLLINGFVHYANEDGIDTCRAEGCKVYKSISDGINAWTYPGGSLFLIINSSDQYNTTAQEIALTHVITQLFGESVDSWIIDHLAASVNANQEGYVDGCNITIEFVVALGMKLTMIGIVP